MDDRLVLLVSDALAQAEELRGLDALRAEVWASDLVSLAAEVHRDGPEDLIEALRGAGGPAAAAALWAIDAVSDLVDSGDPALEPAPAWAAHLRTSQCLGACLLRARRGESAVFRFVDADDNRHVVVVDLVSDDLVPEDRELIGEVTIGPIELLDGLDEDDTGIDSVVVPASELAARVAAAFRKTTDPTSSLAAASRVLIVRLASLGCGDLRAPVWVESQVAELPPRDPEDDAYAARVLQRALGEPVAPDTAVVEGAAAKLRTAAAGDTPLAQWLAASLGPVDLDDDDLTVVLAALAAAVAPATLAPLDTAARMAVVDLEWADWLGVAIGLGRGGPGTSIDPDHLVDLINRCPEVTSTIPKKDRPRIAWALAVCSETWTPLGLADGGVITEGGVALLPAALRVAWGASLRWDDKGRVEVVGNVAEGHHTEGTVGFAE